MTTEPNPYQAPANAEPFEDAASASGSKASRGARLAAATIDGLIQFAIILPVQFMAGVYDGFPQMTPLSFPKTLLWTGAGIVLWLALQSYFLNKSAQTIGKKLLGLQIVNFDDWEPAPFGKIVLWRTAPFMVLSLIPKVGVFLNLLDPLAIFRKDRRCIHDHLAGTHVIKL